MIRESITRNSLLLGAFAVLTTGIIAATQLGTKDRIADQVRQAREKALLEIVPRARHDNQMLDFTVVLDDQKLLNLREPQPAFVATSNNELAAIIFPVVAPDGYSGRIELLVGINAGGDIAGVRVVQHAETPGLGDKIELKKSPWVLSFNGTSLQQPSTENWTVKKDGGYFDQFTGATITARAVVQAVQRALQYYQQNSASIMARLESQNSISQHGNITEAGNG